MEQNDNTISVSVNDEARALQSGSSLSSLAEILNLPEHGIAMALNGKVVQRAEWQKVNLKSNDSILIITATQGG